MLPPGRMHVIRFGRLSHVHTKCALGCAPRYICTHAAYTHNTLHHLAETVNKQSNNTEAVSNKKGTTIFLIINYIIGRRDLHLWKT